MYIKFIEMYIYIQCKFSEIIWLLQLFPIKLTIKFPSFISSSLDTPTCTVLVIVKMNPLSR